MVSVKYNVNDFTYCHTFKTINEDFEVVKTCNVLNTQIIPRIPKLLQPGEKGFILDTPEIREFARNWNEKYKGIIGRTCVISGETGNVDGFYYINESTMRIPYFMVAPVPPEENKLADIDTEEMVKELESRGLLVDGKVLK